MINAASMNSVKARAATAAVIGIELAGAAGALPKGPRSGRGAPKSFTGCVSEISSCAADQHAYVAALKDYAQVYEAYQAYLTPGDTLAQHDYDAVGATAAAEHQLGCLNEELVECTVPVDSISDDDIESCGYLGWVHHS